MEPWELDAREQIRDLVAAYTWAGARGRAADLAACFASDGVLDMGEHGGRREGRAAIQQAIEDTVARVAASGEVPTRVQHHVSSTWIADLTPTTARVRSYFAVHTGGGLDHWGRYLDDVVSDGDRWRFASRRVTVDGASPTSRVVEEPS